MLSINVCFICLVPCPIIFSASGEEILAKLEMIGEISVSFFNKVFSSDKRTANLHNTSINNNFHRRFLEATKQNES